MTPAEITSGQGLPPTISVPVYLTLITSMFIHGGFFHILVNLVFLWIFGDNVEDALGHLTFFLYYMAAGIVAGLANALLLAGSSVPGIGASGAVAAVLAGYLLLFPRAEVRVLLLLVVALAILFGITSLLAAIGLEPVAVLAQGLLLLAVALFALADGVRRIFGRPSFLGSGAGPGRWLAFVQILIVLGIPFGLTTGIG